MRRQLDAMRDAQKPWIGVIRTRALTKLQQEEDFVVSLTIKDSGTGPALHWGFKTASRIQVQSKGEPRECDLDPPPDSGIFVPGQTDTTQVWLSGWRLDESLMKRIKNRQAFLYVVARTDYRDDANERYCLLICLSYIPGSDSFRFGPKGQELKSGKGCEPKPKKAAHDSTAPAVAFAP